MKLSAPDLAKLKLVDEVIPEPPGGAHNDHTVAAASLRESLVRQLDHLASLSSEQMLEQRYQKFRSAGEWEE